MTACPPATERAPGRSAADPCEIRTIRLPIGRAAVEDRRQGLSRALEADDEPRRVIRVYQAPGLALFIP